MFGKKNKNQKKQWIIGFCGLLVIGVAGGMLAAKMTTPVSDTEKTAKDTAGQDSVEEDSLRIQLPGKARSIGITII